jgi:hypothetical protein
VVVAETPVIEFPLAEPDIVVKEPLARRQVAM